MAKRSNQRRLKTNHGRPTGVIRDRVARLTPGKRPVRVEKERVRECIFFTGGIGDVLALEPYFSDMLRSHLHTIHYATSKYKMIRQVFQALPNYPRLMHHVVLWEDFSKFWCFHTKNEVIEKDIAHRVNKRKPVRPPIPENFAESEDWSIVPKFQKIREKKLVYGTSSVAQYPLCDIQHIALPSQFACITPCSTDKRAAGRDFHDGDWDITIQYLIDNNLYGVVLNTGADEIPVHNRIVDLSNKTTMLEAIEILKKAACFIGVDSCLSIVAAKLFTPDRLTVKSINQHFYNCKDIYLAPQKEFWFVVKNVEECPNMTRPIGEMVSH